MQSINTLFIVHLKFTFLKILYVNFSLLMNSKTPLSLAPHSQRDVQKTLTHNYTKVSKKIKNIIFDYQKIGSVIDCYNIKTNYNFPEDFLNPIYYLVHKLCKLIESLDNIVSTCRHVYKMLIDISSTQTLRQIDFLKDLSTNCKRKKVNLNLIIRNIFTTLEFIPNFESVKNPIAINCSPIKCQLSNCGNQITYCRQCFHKNLLLIKDLSVYQQIILIYKQINCHITNNIEELLSKQRLWDKLKYKSIIVKKNISILKSQINKSNQTYKKLCNTHTLLTKKINMIPQTLAISKIYEFREILKESEEKISKEFELKLKQVLTAIKPHLIKIFNVYKLQHSVSQNDELKILVISIYLPQDLFKYSSERGGKKVELIATVLGYIVRLLMILSEILRLPISKKLEYFSNHSKISDYLLHPVDDNFKLAVECLLWTIIDFNYLIFNHYIQFLDEEKKKQFKKYNLKLIEFETKLNIVHVLQFLKQSLLILI